MCRQEAQEVLGITSAEDKYAVFIPRCFYSAFINCARAYERS